MNLGLTIVDSLDTMLIMGLEDHFGRARDWVQKSLDFNRVIRITFTIIFLQDETRQKKKFENLVIRSLRLLTNM